MATVLWSGGPVDEVIRRLQASVAGLKVERLPVTHPGDDDNLWFFRLAEGRVEVQIGTNEGGHPPFLVEGYGVDEVLTTSDVAEAVGAIRAWLG